MNILALDDEPGALKLLVRAINRANPDAQVHSFLEVEEALAFAADNSMDVAFLDVQMPERMGTRVAELLLKAQPQINIIFTTGYSEYAVDAMKLRASGYLTKPVTAEDVAEELSHLRNPIGETERPKLRVQTFGDFAVFCNDVPVPFKRSKSKELLAYLVDRRGAPVNKKEIAAALFGDDYSPQVQNYITKIYRDLSASLEEVGAGDALVKSYNAYAVDTSKMDCDLYSFQDGDAAAQNSFMGEYMIQYEWAEGRLAY